MSETALTSVDENEFSLTRVDKNFTSNSFSTFNEYGEEKTLAQSLVLYFYHKLQTSYTDLLGITAFDPYDFAKTMGYSRTYLQTASSAPYQKEVEGEKAFRLLQEKGEALDSRLENVLYRMTQVKMHLKYGGKLKDGRSITEIDSLSILKKVVFITDPAKPKRKIFGLVFHEEFYSNINSFFSRVELTAFSNLRKANAYNLYLRLVHLQDIMYTKQLQRMETTFNLLCEAAEIDYTQARRNKNELIKKLKIIAQAATSLKVKVDFEKNKNGKHKFQPVLLIEDLQQIDDREKRFYSELFNQLHLLFIKLYPEIVEGKSSYSTDFSDWLFNVNQDHAHKRKCYTTAYAKCFNITLDTYDKRVNTFMSEIQENRAKLLNRFLL